ncbi:MAG TPA: hypothetical protein VG675_09080 [Bryobacteraceae bacterium]|nr:hypothetical protein [Bryobacteraceae bacterium]
MAQGHFKHAEELESRRGEGADDDDPSYAPPADFNPSMRLSQSGETNNLIGRTQGMTLASTSTAFTRIGARAARSSTDAAMGSRAADYAAGMQPAPVVIQEGYEWCHRIAACLGGPTDRANLFCGGFHANTHMLALEQKLTGKTHLEVQVEVRCRQGTVMAEEIVYRVRKPGGSKVYEDSIDSQSTGFSADDYKRVRDALGKWLRVYGRG